MDEAFWQPESGWEEISAPVEESSRQMLKTPGIRRGLYWAAVVLLLLVLAAAAGCFFLFRVNRFSLLVIPEGEQEIILEYGQTYEDPGARVVFQGSRILRGGMLPEDARLQTRSDVREDVLGKYTVTYQAEYLWWQTTATRSVRVVDSQCPVITLEETPGLTVLPGQPYVEEGFSAYDNYDGDITDKVRKVEEMGVITYVVVDSSGNPASAERIVPYYDPEAPVITLVGGESISVPAGTRYEEPGYTALDNEDGDITDQVLTEGEVCWYLPGSYTVRYRVSDAYGNESCVERTVEVTAAHRPETRYPQGKVIYLTFDDGPGPETGRLLDVLKRYNVKATFFVVDSGYDDLLQRIVDEGHSIGIHTMSHVYESLYASPEAFFDELYGMQDIIYRNTGVMTSLMRFPGGSSNLVSSFNPGIMTLLTEAVQDAGFQYFDWNVDSNDAGGALRAGTVVENVTENARKKRISVVLQHDIMDFSVDAVEDIIIWGRKNGYQFLPLEPDSPGAHHPVQN